MDAFTVFGLLAVVEAIWAGSPVALAHAHGRGVNHPA
jgi:hypothetical protein